MRLRTGRAAIRDDRIYRHRSYISYTKLVASLPVCARVSVVQCVCGLWGGVLYECCQIGQQHTGCAELEVLAAVLMKIPVFCDATPF